MERLIENKYGEVHARVIRILRLYKGMDDKKLSEAMLLSLKDTRSVLMQLYTD